VWADPDYYVNWGTFAIEDAYNFISYSNPTLDDLYERGRETLDVDERKAIYGEIQEILAEEQPIIFLDWPQALSGINTAVQGHSAAGTTPPTLLWNVEEWTVNR